MKTVENKTTTEALCILAEEAENYGNERRAQQLWALAERTEELRENHEHALSALRTIRDESVIAVVGGEENLQDTASECLRRKAAECLGAIT